MESGEPEMRPEVSKVRWGGMGIKTGIFEMIIKLFKSDIH